MCSEPVPQMRLRTLPITSLRSRDKLQWVKNVMDNGSSCLSKLWIQLFKPLYESVWLYTQYDWEFISLVWDSQHSYWGVNQSLRQINLWQIHFTGAWLPPILQEREEESSSVLPRRRAIRCKRGYLLVQHTALWKCASNLLCIVFNMMIDGMLLKRL